MHPEIKQLADDLGYDPERVQEMVAGVMRIIAKWLDGGLSPNDLNEEIIAAALEQYAEQYKRMCHAAYLRRNEFALQVLHLLQARAA